MSASDYPYSSWYSTFYESNYKMMNVSMSSSSANVSKGISFNNFINNASSNGQSTLAGLPVPFASKVTPYFGSNVHPSSSNDLCVLSMSFPSIMSNDHVKDPSFSCKSLSSGTNHTSRFSGASYMYTRDIVNNFKLSHPQQLGYLVNFSSNISHQSDSSNAPLTLNGSMNANHTFYPFPFSSNALSDHDMSTFGANYLGKTPSAAPIPDDHPTHWLTTLCYICDSIMSKTNTHIQVIGPASSSPTSSIPPQSVCSSHYNITVVGAYKDVIQARTLIRKAGIFRSCTILRLPFHLAPYLSLVQQRVEEIANIAGVVAFWKTTTYPSHLEASISPIDDILHVPLSEQMGAKTPPKNGSLMLNHIVELRGSLENVEKAKISCLIVFDEVSGYKQEQLQVNAALAHVIAGPYRTELFQWMSEYGARVYLPPPYRIVEHEKDDLIKDQDGLTFNEADTTSTLYIAAVSDSALQRMKSLLINQFKAKSNILVSRSIQVDDMKLEQLLSEKSHGFEKVLNEYGSYAVISKAGTSTVSLTVYSDNSFTVELIIKGLSAMICEYQMAELQLNPAVSRTEDLIPFQASQMSPRQPNSSVLKLKSFHPNINELRSLSSLAGIEVIYHNHQVKFLGKWNAVLSALSLVPRTASFLSPLLMEVRYHLEQPLEVRDFVCGKKDGKLMKVMRCTGSMVQIMNQQEWSILITIISPTILHTLEGTALVQGELPAEVSFYVPEVHHKRIIGHGGKNIQKIMKSFGVYVKFLNHEEIRLKYGSFSPFQTNVPPRADEYRSDSSTPWASGTISPGSWSSIFPNVLVKTPAKNYSALEQMHATIIELSGERDFTPIVESVPIPSHYHSWLLSQSSKLKEICRSTRISIMWHPLEWQSDTVLLKGPALSISMARDFLLELTPKCLPVSLIHEEDRDICLGFLQSEVFSKFATKAQEDWEVRSEIPSSHLLGGSTSVAAAFTTNNNVVITDNNHKGVILFLLCTKLLEKNLAEALARLTEILAREMPLLQVKQVSVLLSNTNYEEFSSVHDTHEVLVRPTYRSARTLSFSANGPNVLRSKDLPEYSGRPRSVSLGSETAFQHFNSVLLSTHPYRSIVFNTASSLATQQRFRSISNMTNDQSVIGLHACLENKAEGEDEPTPSSQNLPSSQATSTHRNLSAEVAVSSVLKNASVPSDKKTALPKQPLSAANSSCVKESKQRRRLSHDDRPFASAAGKRNPLHLSISDLSTGISKLKTEGDEPVIKDDTTDKVIPLNNSLLMDHVRKADILVKEVSSLGPIFSSNSSSRVLRYSPSGTIGDKLWLLPMGSTKKGNDGIVMPEADPDLEALSDQPRRFSSSSLGDSFAAGIVIEGDMDTLRLRNENLFIASIAAWRTPVLPESSLLYPSNRSSQTKDTMPSLQSFLQAFHLEDYIPLFHAKGILDLDGLLKLNEVDLKVIGFPSSLTPSLLQAIIHLKDHEQQRAYGWKEHSPITMTTLNVSSPENSSKLAPYSGLEDRASALSAERSSVSSTE